MAKRTDDGPALFTLRVADGAIEVDGIGLRDYFAAHAPHAPITDFFTDDAADVCAIASYRYADAMLRARAK